MNININRYCQVYMIPKKKKLQRLLLLWRPLVFHSPPFPPPYIHRRKKQALSMGWVLCVTIRDWINATKLKSFWQQWVKNGLCKGDCEKEKCTYWAGDRVGIQLLLRLWWTSHLCRTSRKASWIGELPTCHLGTKVGGLEKIKRRNDYNPQSQMEGSLTILGCSAKHVAFFILNKARS